MFLKIFGFILFGNFHKIMRSFTVDLGLCINIKVFIWHSKFQTDIPNLLPGALTFLSQLSTVFLNSEVKEKLWFIFKLFKLFVFIRMWSFPYLTHIYFTNDLDFINRNSSFVADMVVGSMKVVFGNRFIECAWLAEIPGYKMLTGCLEWIVFWLSAVFFSSLVCTIFLVAARFASQ